MNSYDTSNVSDMFDKIARKYDFLNHLLTLNIDRLWRRKAVRSFTTPKGSEFLDVACGTGDLALAYFQHKKPKSIVGIDISQGMLAIGQEKIAKKKLTHAISLQLGNCESLVFSDNSFDAAGIGFGIRNFQAPAKGLAEIFRVLRPGGELVILEFARPSNPVFRGIYDLYFRRILPAIGKLFSRHQSAYTYLPESVMRFPYGDAFAQMMLSAGFTTITFTPLTFGIVMMYKGTKPVAKS